MNSPVRLGVSPAATSTPTGVFRGLEALFPGAGALGCAFCFAPPQFLPVHLHANVRPPCSQTPPCRESSPPRLTISAPPTGMEECFFFNSWLSDFCTVRFSGSSGCFLFLNCCPSFGCARRQSVLPTPPSWPEVKTNILSLIRVQFG